MDYVATERTDNSYNKLRYSTHGFLWSQEPLMHHGWLQGSPLYLYTYTTVPLCSRAYFHAPMDMGKESQVDISQKFLSMLD